MGTGNEWEWARNSKGRGGSGEAASGLGGVGVGSNSLLFGWRTLAACLHCTWVLRSTSIGSLVGRLVEQGVQGSNLLHLKWLLAECQLGSIEEWIVGVARERSLPATAFASSSALSSHAGGQFRVHRIPWVIVGGGAGVFGGGEAGGVALNLTKDVGFASLIHPSCNTGSGVLDKVRVIYKRENKNTKRK